MILLLVCYSLVYAKHISYFRTCCFIRRLSAAFTYYWKLPVFEVVQVLHVQQIFFVKT